MVLSMDRWRGKVAIVTGASAGIGAKIAQKLVEEGMTVVGFARRTELIENLAKTLKGKLYSVKVDMTKEEDILKGFKWVSDNLGPVNILINNAGVFAVGSLTQGDTDYWKRMFDTNVLGLCIATREAVKIMKANKIDGHIVHINSAAGHSIPPFPEMNIYPASKHAVTALTESLRQEFNHLGLKIKVTSVSPGAVDTNIAQNFEYKPSDPNAPKTPKEIPYLQSEDCADAVVYALSTPPHVLVQEVLFEPLGAK